MNSTPPRNVSILATERVLVVPTAVFHRLGHFQGFMPETDRYVAELLSPQHASYRPRGEMERNPAFKQLIPYVLFRHTVEPGQERVFQYTRGTGQGEDRLHRKRSVGIGGHIAAVDAEQATARSPYQEGMRRELAEEVIIETEYQERCVGLINDDQTEVGRVHLGIVHLVDVAQPAVRPRETEIAEAGFQPVGQILQVLDQFETWSQICMRALFDGSQVGMLDRPVYMDNHATTRVDPRVVEVMLPFFSQRYGNPGSVGHSFGADARAAVDRARQQIAAAVGARATELVFTSGATESNNLAIRGVAEAARRRGNHLVTVVTEHRAVLDPIRRLAQHGYEVTYLDVQKAASPAAGRIAPQQVADALRDDTALVSVMLANNEIGVIQPIAAIGNVCRERGVPLHCDATQAVGKVPVDVAALNVDLMSFTAHKIYGPKGIGALFVRRRPTAVPLEPQITGGGQQGGLRSGTLWPAGAVGFAHALTLCLAEMSTEAARLAELRNRLLHGLTGSLAGVALCGPAIDDCRWRLAGNLMVSFAGVDGEAVMMGMPDLAVGRGAACSAAEPQPSHVLRALGLDDDQVRSSLRFGLGRFNTAADVEFAIATVGRTVERLRALVS